MGDLDYLQILKALDEIPFSVGKRLLTEFLQGKDHASINRNRLQRLPSFGSLSGYEKGELQEMIERLVSNRLIEKTSLRDKPFIKVFSITPKGKQEIINPTLQNKKIDYSVEPTIITQEDRKIFSAFDFFLKPFNDEQKKSITCPAQTILCVAGAGSGKTTTLTKRIEFLSKYRGVDPKKILAITFTRKARQEMEKRLGEAGIFEARVETFNSFCEKILTAYNDVLYTQKMRVISFRERLELVGQALKSLGKTMQEAAALYYSDAQRRLKTEQELGIGFMNDCFTLLDFFKNQAKSVSELTINGWSSKERASVQMVQSVCHYIELEMKKRGLRDYSDQIQESLRLFKKFPQLVPYYDYIMIDEYQDINSVQIQLIDTLGAKNLFCVGDPRQSIYGWRGSQISYIIDFAKQHPHSEIITLVKNYRCTENIVKLINTCIAPLRLPDLESAVTSKGESRLIYCTSELEEREVVMGAISQAKVKPEEIFQAKVKPEEIFVLARTNRQLKELSEQMNIRKIKHILRTENSRSTATSKPGQVTLATVHAIKGLEAELVIVMGCGSLHFPCKTSDHPIVDLIKDVKYDQEEEERRLFYVAMSRAKKRLLLTYTGFPTKFITYSMTKILGQGKKTTSRFKLPERTKSFGAQEMQSISPCSLQEREKNDLKKNMRNSMKEEEKTIKISSNVLTKLKQWRSHLAKEKGMPAYIIAHDNTLQEIAARKPANAEELRQIKGMGPVKLQQYGKAILEIVE